MKEQRTWTLSLADAAVLLGVSTRTVKKYTNTLGLPCRRPGGRIPRYCAEEIWQWVDKQKSKRTFSE